MASRYNNNPNCGSKDGTFKQPRRSSLRHYAMLPPPIHQRGEFHVPPPSSYVQQQQVNQGGSNQAPQTLRSIVPQTGPPNQSSTPPSNELNKGGPPVPQQQPMNHLLVSSQQVRNNQTAAFYSQNRGPPNPSQRMPNQHRSHQQAPLQQSIYAGPATPQIVPMNIAPMFLTGNSAQGSLQYFNGPRPPMYAQQGMHIYGSQAMQTSYAYPSNPGGQTTGVHYPYYIQSRSGHQPSPIPQSSVGQQLHAISLQPSAGPVPQQPPPTQQQPPPSQSQQSQQTSQQVVQQQQQQQSHQPQPTQHHHHHHQQQATVAAVAAAAAAQQAVVQQQQQVVQQQVVHQAVQQQQQPQPLQSNSFQRQMPLSSVRRKNAVAVIDPVTGIDILNEQLLQNQQAAAAAAAAAAAVQQQYQHGSGSGSGGVIISHPASADSSARQTPQPSNIGNGQPQHSANALEVQANFMKQVNQRINNDIKDSTSQQQSQSAHNDQHRILNIAQSSSLKVYAKEFVLSSSPSNSAKETTTPVVSAISNSKEVTIPNKQAKTEKESPAKGRKQKEVQTNSNSTSNASTSHIKNQQEEQVNITNKTDSKSIDHSESGKSKSTCSLDRESYAVNSVEKEEKHSKEKEEKTTSTAFSNTSCVTKSGVKSKQTDTCGDEDINVITDNVETTGKNKNGQTSSRDSSLKTATPLTTSSTSSSISHAPISVKVNKANKKTELNLKGANKEGTDMDAFNDTTPLESNLTLGTNDRVSHVPPSSKLNENQSSKTITQELSKSTTIKDEVNNTNLLKTSTPPSTTPTNTLSTTLISVPISKSEIEVSDKSDEKTTVEETLSKKQDVIKPDQMSTTVPGNSPNVSSTISSTTTNLSSASNFTRTLQNKVDVTAIVRDNPFTQFNHATFGTATTQSSRSYDNNVNHIDDTADSLKNSTNENSSSSSNQVEKIIPELNYNKDQWSPNNVNGKKCYDKKFLLSLKDVPASMKRPENIPDVVLSNKSNDRYSSCNRVDTSSTFNNFGGKSNSMRAGAISKRPSQTGGGQNNSSRAGSKILIPNEKIKKVSISVKGEVELHKVENAWKPDRMVRDSISNNTTEEEKEIESLKKSVRSILNKLTPQKFNSLLEQLKALAINTKERLDSVIELVFMKAVDEPNFSTEYALLCKELSLSKLNIKDDLDGRSTFKRTLILRCQREFENSSRDEHARNRMLEEIESSEGKRKTELLNDLDEFDRKIRRNSVGNIRFIGELYKNDMLTCAIMKQCLMRLLDIGDEESLECLCKLLTTIGGKLESEKTANLDQFFNEMKSLVENRRKEEEKLSSRIRFMILDVIDLRKNKWIPRRNEFNPRTIDEIQKEAEDEQINQALNNSTPMIYRKDNDKPLNNNNNSNVSSSQSDKKRRNVDEGGWQTQSRNSKGSLINVNSNKLKNKPPTVSEPLGSRSMFQSWNKGSNIKSDSNYANMYTALENYDGEKRSSSTRMNSKDVYSSKGPSMERAYKQSSYDGGRNSRSGSQHRPSTPVLQQSQQHNSKYETSSSSQSSSTTLKPHSFTRASAPGSTSSSHNHIHVGGGHPPRIPSSTAGGPSYSQKLDEDGVHRADTEASQKSECSMDNNSSSTFDFQAIQKRFKNNLSEYFGDNISANQFFEDTCKMFPVAFYSKMVANSCLYAMEKSKAARLKTGQLFTTLINNELLSVDSFCEGLEEVLDQAGELSIDVPMVWEYFGDIIANLVTEKTLPLKKLHKSCKKIINERLGSSFLGNVLKSAVELNGASYVLQYWQNSGVNFTDFHIVNEDVNEFTKQFNLEFLLVGKIDSKLNKVINKKQTDEEYFESVRQRLSFFMRNEDSCDTMNKWIIANVGDRIRDEKFIRVLALAVFEHSINKSENSPVISEDEYRLIQKYVDNKQSYELQCLFVVQSLLHKLEYPKGFLLDIFNNLYENYSFALESFIAWDKNNDPAEQSGKGAAKLQLKSFFLQLKNDLKDEGSSDEEKEDEEEV